MSIWSDCWSEAGQMRDTVAIGVLEDLLVALTLTVVLSSCLSFDLERSKAEWHMIMLGG
jgi:hypothetical protein